MLQLNLAWAAGAWSCDRRSSSRASVRNSSARLSSAGDAHSRIVVASRKVPARSRSRTPTVSPIPGFLGDARHRPDVDRGTPANNHLSVEKPNRAMLEPDRAAEVTLDVLRRRARTPARELAVVQNARRRRRGAAWTNSSTRSSRRTAATFLLDRASRRRAGRLSACQRFHRVRRDLARSAAHRRNLLLMPIFRERGNRAPPATPQHACSSCRRGTRSSSRRRVRHS